MSTRHITKEQFSPNTTIDGARIASVLKELEARTNSVPLSDIKYPRSMQYMVLTCLTPTTAGWGTFEYYPPWLDIGSTAGNANERAKGIGGLGGNPFVQLGDRSVAWTSSTQFVRPVVIDSVTLVLESDGDYQFTFTGGPVLPVGYWTKNVEVLIDTDDSTASEDRTLNAKEFHLHGFQEQRWFAPLMDAAPATDMLPLASDATYTSGAAGYHSLILEKSGLNIPISQFSRVRFRTALIGRSANLNLEVPGRPTFVIGYKEMIHG